MLYPNLKFPKVSGRPFFYTNFVATLDGKVAVKKKGYWPIGSKKDHQVLTELRAHADCLIHGGNLAREFGEITLKSINKPTFRRLRARLGKNPTLPYYIITSKPESLALHLRGVKLIRPEQGNWHRLAKQLKNEGFKHVLVEGGPTLLGSFLRENLIDEIFLTIAPKIYGTEEGKTLTLVEGYLFPKNSTLKLRLLSVKPIKDELFLRYKVEK